MRLHLLPLLAFGLAAGVSADTTSVQVRMPIGPPTYWARRLYVDPPEIVIDVLSSLYKRDVSYCSDVWLIVWLSSRRMPAAPTRNASG